MVSLSLESRQHDGAEEVHAAVLESRHSLMTAADCHVGMRVRQRRIAMGVSQEQLADALGITYQQVYKYEHGQNRLTAGRLFEVAQLLCTPVSWFYEGLDGGPGDQASPVLGCKGAIQRERAGHELTRDFALIGDAKLRGALSQVMRILALHSMGTDLAQSPEQGEV